MASVPKVTASRTASAPAEALGPEGGRVYALARKSLVLAYVLLAFGGVVGLHRFYLGRMRSGAALAGLFAALFVNGMILGIPQLGQILMLASTVWVLVDILLLPRLVRERNAAVADALAGYRGGERTADERPPAS